jgi:hypothetical protein
MRAGVGIDGEMRLLCLEAADDGPAMTPQAVAGGCFGQRSRWGSCSKSTKHRTLLFWRGATLPVMTYLTPLGDTVQDVYD